jgi:hypothetical protein
VTGLPDRLPAKRPGVLVADFDTELVVLVPDERQAHRLDEGLSLILSSCDGASATERFVTEIADATGDSSKAVEAWLLDGLRQLERLKIL